MDQKNDLTIKDNSIKDIKNVAIFQNDSDFYLVHKKAEKIAVATYMISNFFTAEEPMKWSLRKVSTELIKDIISLSSASLSVKDSLIRSLVSKIVELISLYEIAHRAGFISSMNFSVIKEELEKILELLNKREDNLVGTKSISFDTAFFEVPKADIELKNESVNLSKISKTQVWNPTPHTPNISHTNTPHFTAPVAPTSSHTEVRKPMSFIKDSSPVGAQAQKDIKDKRQQTILALIKKHRTLTIKGFTGVIKSCSEKTIQRELLALVASGVLKKEGERRWSTYSLA